MKAKLIEALLSKKVWASTVAFVVVLLQTFSPEKFEGLDPDKIAAVALQILPLLVFVFAQGKVDAAKALAVQPPK